MSDYIGMYWGIRSQPAKPRPPKMWCSCYRLTYQVPCSHCREKAESALRRTGEPKP